MALFDILDTNLLFFLGGIAGSLVAVSLSDPDETVKLK